MVISRSSKSIGFIRKSIAPRFIAVRMFGMSPYAETTTAFSTPCRSRSLPSSVSPSITGMLMSLSTTSMVGCTSSACKRFLAVMAEEKLELPLANLTAESLADQQFQIRLVVHHQDLAGRLLYGGTHRFLSPIGMFELTQIHNPGNTDSPRARLPLRNLHY